MDWIPLIVFCGGGGIVEFVAFVTRKMAIRNCANAAICDDPPQWWKHALLRARARKAAADVLKEAKEGR